MSPEEKVPGVTLHLITSAVTGLKSGVGQSVQVVLDAVVDDEELWEEVCKKLQEGLRIYKGEDFHVAVLDVMKNDHADLQREHELLKRELRQEKDSKKQLEEELRRFKEPFERLGKSLGG